MLNYFSGSNTRSITQQFLKNFSFPDDPFQPAWVIAQNKETHEWLSLKVADENGIAAQLKFILPSEFLWRLYRSKDQNLSDELPSDRNAMTWGIYEILMKGEVDLPYFSTGDWEPRKILNLSEQISDVFDLYQNYRPEMMENWLADVDLPDEHIWQAKLWKVLNHKWETHPRWKLHPRRSEAFINIRQWCRAGLFEKILPEKIYVFGLSHMSGPFIDLLCSLSEVIDVDLYVSDMKTAPESDWAPLISSFSTPRKTECDFLIQKTEDTPVSVHIQEDVGCVEVVSNIEIHSCHNPEREAEVLKDRLLKAFDDDPDLGPEDVLVMLPDPDLYGGIVQGIFSDSDRGPSIPVSDLRNRSGKPITESLRLIMDLIRSDFKSSQLSALFMDPNIQQRFGMNDDDILRLEKWIRDNNILFGLGDMGTESGSWKKGLNRIMLGGLMHFDDREDFRGLIPYTGTELSEPLIVALSQTIRWIYHFNSSAGIEKNVGEWLSWSRDIIDNLILDPENEQPESFSEFRMIEKLRRQSAFHDPDTLISYETFKVWFRKQLQGFKARSGRFGQGVTLSTYVPYRSLPFKWIAMLGMNEGTFPLREIRPEFDLIHNDPEPGDRVQKADDTLLFGETLVSAEQTLFISYEGKDQKNDRVKLPSVLVQRLMDEMEEGTHYSFRSHSLHPFSDTNFLKEHDLSYNSHAFKINSLIKGQAISEPFLNRQTLLINEREPVVPITELIDFFRDPAGFYLKEYLAIDHFDRHDELREREVFDIAGLEKYKIDQLLYALRSEGHHREEVEEYLIKADQISRGTYTRLQLREEWSVIDDLYLEILKITEEEADKRDIHIEFDELDISGSLGGIYGDRLLHYRIGSVRAVSLVELWISFNALCACYDDIKEAIFVAKDGSDLQTIRLQRPKLPKDYLHMLTKWYRELNAPADLNFFPTSSLAYAEHLHNKKDHEYCIAKAYHEFNGSDYKRGESDSFYVHTLWKGRDPLAESGFTENALKFWNPYLRSISEE